MSKQSARKSPTSRDARRTAIAVKRSGSELSKAGYEDVTDCPLCGRRVTLRENAQYHTEGGVRTVTHIACKRGAS